MSAERCFFHVPWKMGAGGAPHNPADEPGVDAWIPATDVIETEDGWLVQMEMPGVRAADVSIHLEGRRLIIRGIRRPPELVRCRSYRHLEIRHGFFRREIPLPGPVAENAAAARMDSGVLEIRLPRGELAEVTLRAVRIA